MGSFKKLSGFAIEDFMPWMNTLDKLQKIVKDLGLDPSIGSGIGS